jgi:4-amino-4-deoxy-L-arabinose transferase-like glycosyltransferase
MTAAAPTHPTTWKSPAIVFLVAFTVATAFWLVLPKNVRTTRSTDFTTVYEPVARNILAGNGITTDDGELLTHFPPGYSYILAAVFKIAHPAYLTENLLLQLIAFTAHALTALLIYQMAATIWSRRFALIPAILWITYLPALWFTAVLNSEVAFTPVFYVALLLFWRQLRRPQFSLFASLLIGLILGAAMLIRPIAIAAAFLLAALLWFNRPMDTRRRRLAAIGILLLGNLLAILPWQTFAYLRTGKTFLLSTGGLPSMIDGLTYALPDSDHSAAPVSGDLLAIMEDCEDAYQSQQIHSVSTAFTWLAQQAKERPLAVAHLLATKAARSWFATDSRHLERPLLILQIPYLLAGLLGIILALRWRGPARQMAIISLVFLLYFWAMTILVLSLLRYMVPAMPLLFLFTPGLWVFLRRPAGKLPLQITSRVVE